jgi:hypothetical protein
MSQFNLTITLGDDAMQNPNDIAAAIVKVAEKLKVYNEGFEPGQIIGSTIRDENGNQCGRWEIVPAGSPSRPYIHGGKTNKR